MANVSVSVGQFGQSNNNDVLIHRLVVPVF